MKRLTLIVVLVFGMSLLVGACRSGVHADASKFTIEVLDGIRYIHNHAPQIEGSSPVRLELIGKIGELEGREDKDILYDPVDAARLPNGDILVLEGEGCTVKRFNQQYLLVSSFGRKGLGPGDFISPYLLRLNIKKSLIYVADDSRISWFMVDGRIVDSFKCRIARSEGGSLSRQFRTSGMSLLSDAHVILPSDFSKWEGVGKDALLTVYDGAGIAIRSFGVVKRFEDPLMTLSANIVHFATDNDDNCYVAYAHQNRVDKYSRDGELLFSSDRRLPYEIKTEMKDEVFTSGTMKRVFSWPSVTSVGKGMSVDRNGRIWVLTFLIQPNRFGGFDNQDNLSRCYRFDVFDTQGILLFSVAPPNVTFSSFSIYADRLYLLDPAEESCVHEYRIVYRN